MRATILKPRLSEKAYNLSKAHNTYVFEVSADANKLEVASVIAEEFKVTVENVNVAVSTGKQKRTFLNRRGKFVRGSRSDVKKAYVTLKAGETIPIFAAEDAANAKAEKAAKKAGEKARKETK